MAENKNRQLAEQILEAIDGKDNIVSAYHCATRLRLVLRQHDEHTVKRVKAIAGVIDVVVKAGQFQIVIGNHVDQVFQEFTSLAGLDTNHVEETLEDQSLLDRIIAMMSAIFSPFIYVLAAGGTLQGILIILKTIWPQLEGNGTFEIFNIMSWTPFVFLPLLIAVTASNHFKCNVYTALFANAVLIAPGFTALVTKVSEGEVVKFFGLPLSPTTYSATVIPAIVLTFTLAWFEKRVAKVLPDAVKKLFTPLITTVVMVPLAILVFGPLSAAGANLVSNGYTFISDRFPALAGIIVGGFWQCFVLLGVHWGITPVNLANYAQYGRDSFQAYQMIAVTAQVGAVLAVLIKSRQKEIKSVALSAFITGIFGITEPALYGINLRFKKPFVIGCISGAIGALVASFFQPYSYAFIGLPGPITFFNAYNPEHASSVWGVIIGLLIAMFLPVVIIQFMGYGDDGVAEVQAKEAAEAGNVVETAVNSHAQDSLKSGEFALVHQPIAGELVDITTIDDPVFASEAMGKGIAIRPSDGNVVAPFDGQVVMIPDSEHAIGLLSNEGVELLIHVGMDTVELGGKPFTLHVETGQMVKAGDLMMTVQLEEIEHAGKSTITPIVVTNTGQYQSVTALFDKNDDAIIRIEA